MRKSSWSTWAPPTFTSRHIAKRRKLSRARWPLHLERARQLSLRLIGMRRSYLPKKEASLFLLTAQMLLRSQFSHCLATKRSGTRCEREHFSIRVEQPGQGPQEPIWPLFSAHDSSARYNRGPLYRTTPPQPPSNPSIA